MKTRMLQALTPSFSADELIGKFERGHKYGSFSVAAAHLRASKFVPGEFVEPGWFVHTSCTANKKGPEKQALFIWRRGWD